MIFFDNWFISLNIIWILIKNFIFIEVLENVFEKLEVLSYDVEIKEIIVVEDKVIDIELEKLFVVLFVLFFEFEEEKLKIFLFKLGIFEFKG